jgi:hypothetical protein
LTCNCILSAQFFASFPSWPCKLRLSFCFLSHKLRF